MKKLIIALALVSAASNAHAAEPTPAPTSTVRPTQVGQCLDLEATGTIFVSDRSPDGRYEVISPPCADASVATHVVDCSNGQRGEILDFSCSGEVRMSCTFLCPNFQEDRDARQDTRIQLSEDAQDSADRKIKAGELHDGTQDGRLHSLETADKTHNKRLTSVDERLTKVEVSLGSQTKWKDEFKLDASLLAGSRIGDGLVSSLQLSFTWLPGGGKNGLRLFGGGGYSYVPFHFIGGLAFTHRWEELELSVGFDAQNFKSADFRLASTALAGLVEARLNLNDTFFMSFQGHFGGSWTNDGDKAPLIVLFGGLGGRFW